MTAKPSAAYGPLSKTEVVRQCMALVDDPSDTNAILRLAKEKFGRSDVTKDNVFNIRSELKRRGVKYPATLPGSDDNVKNHFAACGGRTSRLGKMIVLDLDQKPSARTLLIADLVSLAERHGGLRKVREAVVSLENLVQ